MMISLEIDGPIFPSSLGCQAVKLMAFSYGSKPSQLKMAPGTV
jgi:hypothetical protein